MSVNKVDSIAKATHQAVEAIRNAIRWDGLKLSLDTQEKIRFDIQKSLEENL